MRVVITIDVGNAAFEDSGQSGEVARILREMANDLELGGAEMVDTILQDINGNNVGVFRLED